MMKGKAGSSSVLMPMPLRQSLRLPSLLPSLLPPLLLPKKRARRKAAVGKSRVVQEAQPADGEDQDATEVVTKAAPANGRRKKKAATKKAATTGKRGRQPFPDKVMLQTTEGDSTAELFRLDRKWYLTVDGEPANEGNGWISRKQALPMPPKSWEKLK